MEKVFRAETVASPQELFSVVSDLSTFPDWIELVAQVTAESGRPNDSLPAWSVTLRAELGPLARSKRLRMVRTVCQPPVDPDLRGHVRFERVETDGRHHAAWTMAVDVGPFDLGSARSWADCRLVYGGTLWSRPLEGRLDAVAERSAERLQAVASALRS